MRIESGQVVYSSYTGVPDIHHQHLLREFILKWFSIIYVSCFWFYYMMSRSYKHTSFSYNKTTYRYRVQQAAAPICFERDLVKGSIGFCSFHHNGTGGLDFTLVTENTAHIFCSYNSESELTYDMMDCGVELWLRALGGWAGAEIWRILLQTKIQQKTLFGKYVYSIQSSKQRLTQTRDCLVCYTPYCK